MSGDKSIRRVAKALELNVKVDKQPEPFILTYLLETLKMEMLKRVASRSMVIWQEESLSVLDCGKTHPSNGGIAHLIPKGWTLEAVKIHCLHFYCFLMIGG